MLRATERPNENANQLQAIIYAPAQTYASFIGLTVRWRPRGVPAHIGLSAAFAG